MASYTYSSKCTLASKLISLAAATVSPPTVSSRCSSFVVFHSSSEPPSTVPPTSMEEADWLYETLKVCRPTDWFSIQGVETGFIRWNSDSDLATWLPVCSHLLPDWWSFTFWGAQSSPETSDSLHTFFVVALTRCGSTNKVKTKQNMTLKGQKLLCPLSVDQGSFLCQWINECVSWPWNWPPPSVLVYWKYGPRQLIGRDGTWSVSLTPWLWINSRHFIHQSVDQWTIFHTFVDERKTDFHCAHVCVRAHVCVVRGLSKWIAAH